MSVARFAFVNNLSDLSELKKNQKSISEFNKGYESGPYFTLR